MQKYNEEILKANVGMIIAQQRRANKMSQEALAEKLDIHIRTVGKIEHGKSFPTADVLCKLSALFNMPVKSFFEFDEPEDINVNDLEVLIDKLKNSDNDFIKLYLKIMNFIDSKCYK